MSMHCLIGRWVWGGGAWLSSGGGFWWDGGSRVDFSWHADVGVGVDFD